MMNASGKLVGALFLTSCIVSPGVAAAQAGQVTTVEEIVVTGQRASDRDSLQKKRSAVSAVEVVSANDVGKLPDQNVAESVRRLTGVSVATDKGEGRYLIIRGIEPNLANVTINNQTASAPEPADRNVKLDDIPSALIGSVTVVKSLTPDLDANAIAGQVDINTLTAFDRKKNIFSARYVRGTYENSDRKANEGDLSVGGKFGAEKQFGLVLAVNYSKRPSYSEDVLATSRQVVNGVDLPAEMDQRIYDPAWRTRKGAVANFDWRPNDDVKLYARIMYSEFGDSESRNRFRFFFPGSASSYSNLTANGGDINTGSTTARRLFRQRSETTDTTTFSVGGDVNWGVGTLTVQATHAESNKKDPIRDEVEFRASASTGLGATFKLGDEMPDSFVVNAATLNPANYRLNNYKRVSRKAGEDLNQLRADYKVPMSSWGEGSYLKFGAKYLKRDRFQDQTGRTFAATGAAASQTLASFQGNTVPLIADGKYSFGPTIDFKAARNYVDSNSSLFTVNASDQISQSVTSDYRVIEKVTAAYVMAAVQKGDLTILPGVRVERTEGDTKAIAFTPTTTLNSTYNSAGSYSYTNYFPGVNLKYQFSSHLLARGAITTALGRPPFVDLAPTVTVDTASNTVNIGNPNLKPQKATNYDLSLEYYFPSEGGISIGLFHKDIENPIFNSTATGQNGTYGGVSLTNAIVNSYANGTSAKVTGLEFSFQKPLTFLPSPLDGFGVNFNMTFTDGELKVPGRSVKTPLIGQAKRIASAQVYYEKYGFSGRLAYTHHSSYLDTDGGLNVSDATGRSDGYFGALSTLDAKVAYKVTKQFEIFAEANNLNDTADYYFFQNSSRFRESEAYGRSYRFGMSFTY
jgi:TonB-dependent receptor